MRKLIGLAAVILGLYSWVNIKFEAEKLRDEVLFDIDRSYVQQYHSLGCDNAELECSGNARTVYIRKYDSPDSQNYKPVSYTVPAPCFIRSKPLREACYTAKETKNEAQEKALPISKYVLQTLLD